MKEPATKQSGSKAPAIITEQLGVKFGNFTAVDNVTFSVNKGEVFGLLGPNGSGKTTIIKALCGLLKQATGKASLLGLDIRKDADKIKRKIGYMSQKFSLYEELTAEENLNFYGGAHRLKPAYLAERKEAVVKLTNLAPYLNRRASALSGGWKQRLALACAIIHEPEILFLDEPTAGIDPVARRELWDLLFKLSGQGITCFITTHYMDEAERCRRVGYIYLSKLIAVGTIDELRAIPEVNPENSQRLEIICASPSEALGILKELPYILESTIFGQALHVLIDTRTAQDQLKKDLAQAGFPVSEMRPIQPSLEDVFVTLTNSILRKKSAGGRS